MDNNNLDAKTPRLNPYHAPPNQMKQEREREKLPPSPTEPAKGQAPYPTARPSAPWTGGYPAAMGGMDPAMQDMAGRAEGYPAAGTPSAGFPAAGMQATGFPATGMQAMSPRAAGAPFTGPATGLPAMGFPAAGAPAAGMPTAQILPGMPTGMPAGGVTGTAPITPFNQPIPVTTESTLYINGFLRTMIGRKVTVDFLIGTNTFTDRTGTLLAVGADYIVLNEVETDDILVCDFFSIKFVTVYY